MARPQFDYHDIRELDDQEQDFRALIPNQRYWYDMEECDVGYVAGVIPSPFETSQLQSLARGEGDLGADVRLMFETSDQDVQARASVTANTQQCAMKTFIDFNLSLIHTRRCRRRISFSTRCTLVR